MSNYVSLAGRIVVTLIQIFFTMFTISTIWGWFIVPLGAPVIGWAQAYGLSLVIAYLTLRFTPAFNASALQAMTFGERIGRAFGVNAGILFLGWIGSLFM